MKSEDFNEIKTIKNWVKAIHFFKSHSCLWVVKTISQWKVSKKNWNDSDYMVYFIVSFLSYSVLEQINQAETSENIYFLKYLLVMIKFRTKF